jgi:hypothetical protein
MDLSHFGVFYNSEEVNVAVSEWLRMKEPDLHSDGVFKQVPRWEKCIFVLEDHVEKQ